MFLTPIPRAGNKETLKLKFFLASNRGKKLFFFFNVGHFVIYAYIFKVEVRALASVILNLKVFEFFVLDGPSLRFHQQRRQILYRKSV